MRQIKLNIGIAIVSLLLATSSTPIFARPIPPGRGDAGASPPPKTGQPAPAIAAGCVDWPSNKFLQTPFTPQANGSSGYARVTPGGYFNNGEFHINCNSDLSANQYYALDLALNRGDQALSPGGAGKVLYAGPTKDGWASCGNTVVVDHGGNWWSWVCHLDSVSVHVGQVITNDTVIGRVGSTGGDYAPHLHFALFKNAKLGSGGVYGGQSARPRHMWHLRGKAYYDTIQPHEVLSY